MFNKRVAICFAGQGRCVEYTHENIKENLIKPFKKCDIFMYIAKDKDDEKPLKYFNNVDIMMEYAIREDNIFDEKGITHQQTGPLQDYLRMNYSRKMVNKMRVEYEKKHSFEYDIVIHSRLDVKYGTSLSMFKIDQMDMNYLYTPDFHNFPIVQGAGINDRFAMSNSKNMNIYFNLFNYIRKDSDLGNIVHGESTLFRYLKREGIQIRQLPIRFCRINKDGKERDGHIIHKSKEQWQWIERE